VLRLHLLLRNVGREEIYECGRRGNNRTRGESDVCTGRQLACRHVQMSVGGALFHEMISFYRWGTATDGNG